jgi:hypothetical protein
VALVSYLRIPGGTPRSAHRKGRAIAAAPRRGGRARYFVAPLLLLAGLAVAAAAVLSSARASVVADSSALARIELPLGGGAVQSVKATTGPHSQAVPVDVRGGRIWPRGLIAAHELISLEVVVKRPGWISWLAGARDHLRLTLYTPSAGLREHYLTVRAGAPLRLEFNRPIEVLAYGPPGQLQRRVLNHPESQITLDRTTPAGTLEVAAAPRLWETSSPAQVSWFPAGAAASAVASPAPGTRILPTTPITLTFSKPVGEALGASMPPVTPATPGSWHSVNSHTIAFRPEGAGYGLSTSVGIGLPRGVQLVGGQETGTSSAASWPVPPGSALRMQQILAQLGYLPLSWSPSGAAVAADSGAQEAAAISPPAGSFRWRFGNVPASLKGFWQPGASGVVTRGALMAFQNEHGLATDGSPGPAVWRSLITAAIAPRRATRTSRWASVRRSSSSGTTARRSSRQTSTQESPPARRRPVPTRFSSTSRRAR